MEGVGPFTNLQFPAEYGQKICHYRFVLCSYTLQHQDVFSSATKDYEGKARQSGFVLVVSLAGPD